MIGLLALWWVWLCAALVLGLIEILVPGFIFLGFALGALAMSVLIGLGMSLSVSATLALFAALSLAAWAALRRSFKGPAGQVKTFDHDIND